MYLAPTLQEQFWVELVEWKQPRPVGHPYEQAIHLGIYRMAFIVADAQSSFEELRRQGVERPPPVLLDIMPGVRVSAVFFQDPDGTTLGAVEAPRGTR